MPKPSWGSGVAGAISGAGTGFALTGNPFVAAGTGLLGGAAGLFGGPSKAKNKKLDLETPEQKELRKLLTEGVTKGEGPFASFSAKFNQDEFEKGVSQPALKNFMENILPQLQYKFAGRGKGGSGAERAQAQAARGLQSDLAQLMYQAQNQQKQTALQGAQTALGGRGFENIHTPASPGAFASGVNAALPEIVKGAANYYSQNQNKVAPAPSSPPTAVG